MIHINEGNRVSILIIIENNTDLFKDELNIESRCLTINFVIHNNLKGRSERMQIYRRESIVPCLHLKLASRHTGVDLLIHHEISVQPESAEIVQLYKNIITIEQNCLIDSAAGSPAIL